MIISIILITIIITISIVRIQAFLRGRTVRIKYLKMFSDKKKYDASLIIQCMIRIKLASKKVSLYRLRRNRSKAAIKIQQLIRQKLAKNKLKRVRELKKRTVAAIIIEKIVRGTLSRMRVKKMKVFMKQFKYVVKIQAMIRGALSRINIKLKLKLIEEYKEMRRKSITKIQALVRGYRGKVLYQMMLFRHNKLKRLQNNAIIKIQLLVRQYLAKSTVKKLKKKRYEKWISDSRIWIEQWDDDSQQYYYFNKQTQDSSWEPLSIGYTRADGYLVLTSGEVIEDPIVKRQRLKAENPNLPGKDNNDNCVDDMMVVVVVDTCIYN